MTDTIYVNGKGTDGLIHVAHPTERFKTLCGWQPPLDQRWYTQSSDTPTCSKCIAMSAEPDHTAAVIEAARGVLKHVSIGIVTRAQQNYLEVSAWAGTTHCLQWYEESADEFPDTFLGNIAVLRGAIDAYDEEIESEGR